MATQIVMQKRVKYKGTYLAANVPFTVDQKDVEALKKLGAFVYVGDETYKDINNKAIVNKAEAVEVGGKEKELKKKEAVVDPDDDDGTGDSTDAEKGKGKGKNGK